MSTATEVKHTPGPWTTEGVRILAADDSLVAWVEAENCDLSIAVADAHLIAAAPDLLQALEAIRSHWQSGNFSRRQDLWDAMDAAILKARGGR